MTALDVVIKDTEPLRLAESGAVVPALSPEHIGRVFLALSPKLIGHLEQEGARPGMLVHYYDQRAEDGTIGVHVGYEIGQQSVRAGGGVEIVELPVIRVASLLHRGGMEGIVGVYEALFAWIEEHGYRVAANGRELYREMCDGAPELTELQIPITN